MGNVLAAIGEGILGGMNFFQNARMAMAKQKLEERGMVVQERGEETARRGVEIQKELIEQRGKIDKELADLRKRTEEGIAQKGREHDVWKSLWGWSVSEKLQDKVLSHQRDEGIAERKSALGLKGMDIQATKDVTLSNQTFQLQMQERASNSAKVHSVLESELRTQGAASIAAQEYLHTTTITNLLGRIADAKKIEGPRGQELVRQFGIPLRASVKALNDLVKTGRTEEPLSPIMMEYQNDYNSMMTTTKEGFMDYLLNNGDAQKDPVLSDIRWISTMMMGDIGSVPMGSVPQIGISRPSINPQSYVGKGISRLQYQSPFTPMKR